jgi:hypothetical protein
MLLQFVHAPLRASHLYLVERHLERPNLAKKREFPVELCWSRGNSTTLLWNGVVDSDATFPIKSYNS